MSPILSTSENLNFFLVFNFEIGISAPKKVQHGKTVPSYRKVRC